jgi:hypothetical protein
MLMAPHLARCRQFGLSRDEVVAETLVRAFLMIMMDERANGSPEVPSPSGTMRSKHSDLMDKTNRSANAFRLGLRAGRSSGFTPLSRRSRRKTGV